MPAAGRLDRRVVIERKSDLIDEVGQPIETWETWKSAWMGKRDIRAEERFRAGADQELATETTVWMSHWIEGLRSDDRLRVEGKIYDIIGISELGRRSGLEITATATRV